MLDKTFPKLNCFTLHGRSNAGKTFWLSPLTQALPDIVGQTIQSQDFAYQGCCDNQVIEIPELTLTKPEQVEETKKVFEGIPTMVNIKNKEPKKLERTPVLSCNTLPWSNFLNEQKALRNHMFIFENLEESAVLEEVDKPADIRFFLRTFAFIKNEIATTAKWPQTPTDDFWSLYQDRVTDYLKDTIKSNTMTLETILQQHIMSELGHCRVMPRDGMQDTLSWIPRRLLKDNTQEVKTEDLKTVMAWLMDDMNEDYYFDMKDYRNPKLISGMTDRKYIPECDIDEQDFLSFKKGYVNIERLQLRLKNTPLPTGTFTVEHMMRECLRKMSSILLHIIRTEAPLMRKEEDHSLKFDQELSFGAHIQAASTPEQLNTTRKRKTPDLSPILAPEPKKQRVEETNRRLFNPPLPKLKIDFNKKTSTFVKNSPPKQLKDLDELWKETFDRHNLNKTIEYEGTPPPEVKQEVRTPPEVKKEAREQLAMEDDSQFFKHWLAGTHKGVDYIQVDSDGEDEGVQDDANDTTTVPDTPEDERAERLFNEDADWDDREAIQYSANNWFWNEFTNDNVYTIKDLNKRIHWYEDKNCWQMTIKTIPWGPVRTLSKDNFYKPGIVPAKTFEGIVDYYNLNKFITESVQLFIKPEDRAESLISFAFSGNQECANQVESEHGLSIHQLSKIARGDYARIMDRDNKFRYVNVKNPSPNVKESGDC